MNSSSSLMSRRLVYILAVVASLAVVLLATYYLTINDEASIKEAVVSEYEERMAYYQSQFHQPAPLLAGSGVEQCTMLMATYKRLKMLPEVLRHYCSTFSVVGRIVLVWNDPSTPLPLSVRKMAEECGKDMVVIPMKENKLTNRLMLQNLEGNETDCIFMMDDDIIISWQDLRFGLKVWQKFQHNLVGFEGRTRAYSILKDGSYFYGTSRQPNVVLRPKKGSYAIMLPGFFIHKAYLEMLFDPVMVPPRILEHVNEVMNCEDILLSMMVTKFVRDANIAWTGGIAIKPRKAIRSLHLRKNVYQGLSTRANHYTVRSGCLQSFVQYFGNDSLVLTELGVMETVHSSEYFVREELLNPIIEITSERPQNFSVIATSKPKA